MREYWAERLLATIMHWTPERIADERPIIQAMADYKYDEYQQFAPGMHFVESLANWLNQFSAFGEREIAYDFVKERLIFISSAEMQHLVSVAYPDLLRPRLMRRVAKETNHPYYHLQRIVAQDEYKFRVRRCLFAGLSDGASVGLFRRANRKELSHEQILQSHEITASRAKSLLDKLRRGLESYGMDASLASSAAFADVILLDDFSGSGLSCLRFEDNKWKGKIPKFFSDVSRLTELPEPIALLERDLHLTILIYVASQKALSYLSNAIPEYARTVDAIKTCEVLSVHELPSSIYVNRMRADDPLVILQEGYFDSKITDEHMAVGGTDGRFGFADAGLPLVLNHNTPNNSISLLFAYENLNPRGLFPRVSRHLEV